jgi:magnesium transporter
MRTLFTIQGRVGDALTADIKSRLAAADKEGFWLDIEAPTGEDYELLADAFRFHPLTIEDIQHQNQRPKVDEYPEYNFAVIFLADWQGEEMAFLEHFLFVGPSYLVSVHHDPARALAALQDRITKSPELAKGQPAFLTYLVVDALVDASFPVLEQLDETVDQLEDEITQKASSESLNRIYHLKHSVTEMRRFLGAQRDVFQRLITHGIHLQQQDMTLYYRDVYDHIVRQYETVDSLRDLLTSAMDVYLSTVSNRLNQTTKTLTVIASLFCP